MKTILFVGLVMIGATGCFTQPPVAESAAPATTKPVDTTDRYTDQTLAKWLTLGSVQQYYNGDGLGENLYLTLLSGGHCVLTWKGCMGRYGAAAGTWRVSAKQLEFQPAEEHGSLAERPIRRLQIRVIDQEVVLIEDKQLEWVKKNGVDRYGCFRAGP